jgi:IS5 family transposase
VDQLSFSDAEHHNKRKRTRREIFLDEMDRSIPWDRIESIIEPFYPKAGNGRRPYPLSTMLRIHCLQQWYCLSDPTMEEELSEIASMRQFAGLPSGFPIPDETTILKFRHLLERHNLTRLILNEITDYLQGKGLMLRQGSIVDATIIAAPCSTKNAKGERDPEMHQTKKGNQWYFGMKAHIGVDAQSGLVHSVTCTAANEHDLNQAEYLLHGEEEYVFADAGYQGVSKRSMFIHSETEWHVAERPGRIRAMKKRSSINKINRAIERTKASIRAKVEHPFRVIKCQFGFIKARYRGMKKNGSQLNMLFALSNLFQARRKLLLIA